MIDLILGAGKSGHAAAKLALKLGHKVYLFDDRAENLLPLEKSSTIEVIPSITRALKILEEKVDRLITSPGVPVSHPLLKAAREQSKPIISEVEFGLTYLPGVKGAITGTNGKSTTCFMAEQILRRLGLKAKALGNIGTPVSEQALSEELLDCVIVELSSYQLEQSSHLSFAATGITNLSPDHLARHKTLENYYTQKAKILKQGPSFVTKETHDTLVQIHKGLISKQTKVLEEVSSTALTDEIKALIGEAHNQQNALLALHICSQITQKPVEALTPYLKKLSYLEHRYEVFLKKDKWSFINDSKSTNLSSTLSALHSTNRPALLFLGGVTKGESFQKLTNLREKIQLVVIFGQDRKKILSDLENNLPTKVFSSLKEAMENFSDIMKEVKEGPVLFSPGGASQDEFLNFEERGLFFKNQVLSFVNHRGLNHGRPKGDQHS